MKKIFEKYRELILYIVMGVLTTIVYFIVRFTGRKLGLEEITYMLIAQFAAITFAYATNKIWVFQSKTETKKSFWREVYLFYSARTVSIFIDLAITAIFVKWNGEFFAEKLGLTKINYERDFFRLPIVKSVASDALLLNEFIFITIGQVLILVSNYLFSKFIIFRKKQKEKAGK